VEIVGREECWCGSCGDADVREVGVHHPILSRLSYVLKTRQGLLS
jgi:hypothetical protein